MIVTAANKGPFSSVAKTFQNLICKFLNVAQLIYREAKRFHVIAWVRALLCIYRQIEIMLLSLKV